MKKLIFTLASLMFFLILTPNILLSLDNKELKENDKEKFIIPDDNNAINELLDEQKIRKLQLESEIEELSSYNVDLESFKLEVSGFDYNLIEVSLKEIEKSKLDEKEIFNYEATILDELYKLMYNVRPSRYDYSNSKIAIETFNNKIEKISKDIRNFDIIKSMIDNHDNESSPSLNDQNKLIRFKTFLASTKNLQNQILEAIEVEIKSNNSNIQVKQNELDENKKYKNNLLKKLNEDKAQINGLSIKLGLPLFCLTILLLFLGPKILQKYSKKIENTSTNETLQAESSQSVLLEISTVLLLTMSILILGLSDKINGDVLGTLIGGISGYVLNRISSSKTNTI